MTPPAPPPRVPVPEVKPQEPIIPPYQGASNQKFYSPGGTFLVPQGIQPQPPSMIPNTYQFRYAIPSVELPLMQHEFSAFKSEIFSKLDALDAKVSALLPTLGDEMRAVVDSVEELHCAVSAVRGSHDSSSDEPPAPRRTAPARTRFGGRYGTAPRLCALEGCSRRCNRRPNGEFHAYCSLEHAQLAPRRRSAAQ
eukprot:gnl/Chilomastix_cuspidata/1902.p1 GENE.gnl/Chilomastix_cuspidata/1902~~gnl/Chilomastix_cuspidata/1902.p1  ORF type:complete len:195 (+),score=56.08 gnl/Chilomastix_cuspidata/1902:433-1017(+)